MKKLVFNNDKISDIDAFVKLCPFGAIENNNGKAVSGAGCKMCGLCVKKGPEGAAVIEDDGESVKIDKSKWKGISVFVDHEDGEIHPVTYELIGKAKELAKKINQQVSCVFIGSNIRSKAENLLYYGVDEVFVYDDERLRYYIPEVYTSVFEDYINKNCPCAILVGATTVGRELAPRIAARFKTGLTADCTILDINENTDLVQIRPAFGGNIMAQIITPNNRPQMATVRYKVMNAPEKGSAKSGKITECKCDDSLLYTTTEVLDVKPFEKIKTIESADVLVVAGRGVKTKEDLSMLEKLSELLSGELACTRPLVEAGWFDAKNQIGLSGRTVRPKLIITCGVSGAVQFAAGMNNSEYIFSINKDENAPIFKVANYGIVGDIYDIVPKLIERLEGGR